MYKYISTVLVNLRFNFPPPNLLDENSHKSGSHSWPPFGKKNVHSLSVAYGISHRGVLYSFAPLTSPLYLWDQITSVLCTSMDRLKLKNYEKAHALTLLSSVATAISVISAINRHL